MPTLLPAAGTLPTVGPVLLCYDGSDHAAQAIRRAGMILRPKHAIVIRVANRAAMRRVAESGRRTAVDAGFEPVAIAEPEHRPSATVILDEAQSRGVSVIVIAARGRSTKQPAFLGDVSSMLVRRSRIPLLVVPPGDFASPASEPVFVCYDGSRIARHALATAAGVLAGRTAMVAAFVPTVDDSTLLRSNLPWPVDGEMEDRLARIDREEGEVPVRRAADGARIAAAAGFDPRPVAIPGADASSEEEQDPWRRLLRAAVYEDAACLVVGHRPSVAPLESTAYGLVHHSDRPVLVVPGEGNA
jgi:nucleotide-binding universal stress UspA family protein